MFNIGFINYETTVEAGWDLTNASYDNVNVSISAQEGSVTGLFFKPDGTKMYIIGSANDRVYQYTLSTAWLVSSATYDSVNFSVTSQDSNPQCVFFKSDGLTMYVAGGTSDAIFQYTLSTAWVVSSASYTSKSLDISSEDVSPQCVCFKSDGLTMYMSGGAGDSVYQYTLSTAWDISTGTYANKSLDISGQDGSPQGLVMKPDGNRLFLVGATNDNIYQYDLSTSYDISTGTYNSVFFDVSSQETSPQGLYIKPDGLKLYLNGSANDRVYQYSL